MYDRFFFDEPVLDAAAVAVSAGRQQETISSLRGTVSLVSAEDLAPEVRLVLAMQGFPSGSAALLFVPALGRRRSLHAYDTRDAAIAEMGRVRLLLAAQDERESHLATDFSEVPS